MGRRGTSAPDSASAPNVKMCYYNVAAPRMGAAVVLEHRARTSKCKNKPTFAKEMLHSMDDEGCASPPTWRGRRACPPSLGRNSEERDAAKRKSQKQTTKACGDVHSEMPKTNPLYLRICCTFRRDVVFHHRTRSASGPHQVGRINAANLPLPACGFASSVAGEERHVMRE